MKKQLLSLSVAAAIALVGVVPASYADDDDECDGVLVQSRFALANCMVESAVAIAAAAAGENGCKAGEWTIEAIVPELYLATIPIQGLTHVYNGTDRYDLTGQSSAQLQNNVNCQVNTTASANSFDGQELTYSAGSGNYYVDAIIDKDDNMLCITNALSAGNIALGDDDFNEQDSLMFEDEDDAIEAAGLLSILKSRGRGRNTVTELVSGWVVDEAVSIPDLGETAEEGFEMTATSNDIASGCKIEIEGSVQNLVSYTVEGEEGGLTITGTLSVEPADED
jgi:hypothetical protein